jgi:hypothetical protein
MLTASALVASNMGFKLNYSLVKIGTAVDVGTSKSGQSTLALPDNRQTGLNSASALMTDVGFASVSDVRRWVRSADGFTQIYTGRIGSGADFPLTSGEGYIVHVKTSVNYIAVGSDDPALATSLVKIGSAVDVGTSKSGQSCFAYNYHQTAATASALMTDVGFASVSDVRRWVRSADGFTQIYTGRIGSGADFALTPGEAYIIHVKTSVNYTPSHY